MTLAASRLTARSAPRCSLLHSQHVIPEPALGLLVHEHVRVAVPRHNQIQRLAERFGVEPALGVRTFRVPRRRECLLRQSPFFDPLVLDIAQIGLGKAPSGHCLGPDGPRLLGFLGLTVIILPPPSTGFLNPFPSTTVTCVTAPSTVAPSVSVGRGGRARDPSLLSDMMELLAGTKARLGVG